MKKIDEKLKGSSYEILMNHKGITASVMIPLIEDEEGHQSVIFQIRAGRIMQAGDVCFPGGRHEAGETPEQCVAREICEELLLDPEQVEVVAPLFRMVGPGGADIHCLLGKVRGYQGTFNPDEVERVIIKPVDELLAMEPKEGIGIYQIAMDETMAKLIPQGAAYKPVPERRTYYFYDFKDAVCWGMTGTLLHGFLQKLR